MPDVPLGDDPVVRLYPLLRRLSAAVPRTTTRWQNWFVQPVTSGMNNRVYRATSEAADLAIKFTIPDARQRAPREYRALEVLAAARPGLAPTPLLHDGASFALPVCVATWLAGAPLASPPTSDKDVRLLLDHYAAIHTVPVDGVELQPAVLTMFAAAEGQQIVVDALAQLPDEAVTNDVVDLVGRLSGLRLPAWEPARPVLCRCDGNFRNFIRMPDGWASVDWEYSGLGDPAFEMAELAAHVATGRKNVAGMHRLLDQYADLRGDPQLGPRSRIYLRIMLVWWVVRLARLLYEGPRKLDERLADPAPDRERHTAEILARYIKLAKQALDEDRLRG